ncbi:2-oxoglutarate synthase, subunit alpha [Desulfonema limicola]|uniref:2-oxoglutarate synthase, subunit alpha n=1 Tax=Desulfonema limicola TaxID=45656 RepID=A0A975BBB2_9BACT|nr:transketolase C-terminal domain-containing protein [Desulfonema limicola]QTA82070.1 2-oxoglutarate synthase, subunit alpha [Desulfonema limicola]
MGLSFLEGNEAIAWGAVAAGCSFFAGYPITPATTVFNSMLNLLPPAGGICLQGEDEIASIGFCLGASMAGRKAMTATSGPGISLYSEQISFATGSEIPIVIVNVQRLGPSTGSATKGADGDIQFMRWGNSGGQPVIVLAPVDVEDCYILTIHAFNLAEQYRCPVFIAANKEISMTRESVDLKALDIPAIINRKTGTENKPFLPFGVSDKSLVPDFLPVGSKTLVRQTSSTHGPDGYITVDPGIISQTQERLYKKICSGIDKFTYYEADTEPDSDTLVICYGVTARAAKTAVYNLRKNGKKISLLILKTLWPVPEKLILKHARSIKRVIVPEMNLGQYVREIERILKGIKIEFLGRMDGNLIKPAQIEEMICNE